MRGVPLLLLLIIAWSIQPIRPGHAQVLTATSSLIRVPTGYMGSDGLVTIAGGALHRKDVPLRSQQHHVSTYSVGVTFLPFLELGFRFNRKMGAVDALGDRMIIARLQLLTESRYRPAVAVGAHDFIRSSESLTTKFHALYAVGSKQLPASFIGPLHAASIHVGYASRFLEAQSYELDGFFGGLELRPTRFLRTMLEYDGRVNVGQSMLLFNHLELMVALHEFSRLAGGGSFRIQL